MNKSKKYLDAVRKVDDFNQRFPVGTDVMLRKDIGVVKTRVREKAFVFLDTMPVAFFQGISGAYSIDGRVSPVVDAQESHACPQCNGRLERREEYCPDQHVLMCWYWLCVDCKSTFGPDPEDFVEQPQ